MPWTREPSLVSEGPRASPSLKGFQVNVGQRQSQGWLGSKTVCVIPGPGHLCVPGQVPGQPSIVVLYLTFPTGKMGLITVPISWSCSEAWHINICTCSAHRKHSVSVICYNHCGYCCHSFSPRKSSSRRPFLEKPSCGHTCPPGWPFPSLCSWHTAFPYLALSQGGIILLPHLPLSLTQSTVWPPRGAYRAW